MPSSTHRWTPAAVTPYHHHRLLPVPGGRARSTRRRGLRSPTYEDPAVRKRSSECLHYGHQRAKCFVWQSPTSSSSIGGSSEEIRSRRNDLVQNLVRALMCYQCMGQFNKTVGFQRVLLLQVVAVLPMLQCLRCWSPCCFCNWNSPISRYIADLQRCYSSSIFCSACSRYHGSTPVLLSRYQFNSSVCCRPSVLPQLQPLLQCMLSQPTSMLLLYKGCNCYNLRWSSIGLYQGKTSRSSIQLSL
jgi:hypothetical protein